MLNNSSISELLILEAEKADGHRELAFRRAAHSAFMWPVEAGDLVKAGARRQQQGVDAEAAL